MVLLFCGILSVISLIVLCIRRNRDALLTFFCCCSLSLFLYGVLLYIAKKGGVPARMIPVFFLNNSIRLRLQYQLILLRGIGLLIALGRYTFPFFLLILALESTTFLSKRAKRIVLALTPVLPLSSIIVYHQPVFQWLTNSSVTLQRFIVNFSFAWVVAYSALAVLLCTLEYFRISVPLIRRKYLQRTAMIIGLAGLFLINCKQDPAQAFMFYNDDFMWGLGLWYLSPFMSFTSHIIILSVLTLCSMLSLAYMVRLAVLEVREKHRTHEAHRKFDMARVGGNIFVHSIKNQLLAQRVIYRKMSEQISEAPQIATELSSQLASVQEINDTLMTHINDLYHVFKKQHLHKSPVLLQAVLDETRNRLQMKYPTAAITMNDHLPYAVYADENVLCEAILNIVMNAWEANVQAGHVDIPVMVQCYTSQQYIVIEITDHGVGIPRAYLRKIYEPFYTSKNSNSNWGMGLYHAHAAIKKHYGMIHVESHTGQGTKFFILLPLLKTSGKGARLQS